MFFHYLDLSWRSFKRTPVISVLMVVAIAIGIGITMTSLSVYHMMSMNPIPSKSDKLIHVQLQTMDEGNTWSTDDNIPFQMTYQDAKNLANAPIPERKVQSMKSGFSVHLNSNEVKPFIETARMTGHQFFDMFNLEFIYGAPWTVKQEEDAAPVVVIGEEINDKLFAGENSVGEMIYLDNRSYMVTGVVKDWNIHIKYYDMNNGAFHSPELLFLPFSLIEAFEMVSWGNNNGWKFEEINNFQQKLQSEEHWIQFWVEIPNEQEEKAYREYLMAYMQEQQSLGRFNREKLEYGFAQCYRADGLQRRRI